MPSGDRGQVQWEPDPPVGQPVSLLAGVALLVMVPCDVLAEPRGRAGSVFARVKASMAAEKAAPRRSACVAAALPHRYVWDGAPAPPTGRMQTGSAPADAGGYL